MSKSYFNFLCFRLEHYNRSNIIEWNIANSFWIFLQELWKKNILEAPVFANTMVVKGSDFAGRYDPAQLDQAFLGRENFQANRLKILRIRIWDLWSNNAFCEPRILNELTGINLPLNKYLVIRKAVVIAIKKYNGVQNNLVNNKNISLLQFLKAKTKGCGPVRRLLATNNYAGTNMIRTFCSLISLDIPNIAICKSNLGLWNRTQLPNWIRNFAFNFFRNSLPLVARVFHRTTEPSFLENGCKNCQKLMCGGIPMAPCRETFLHTFWDCVSVNNLLTTFCSRYFPHVACLKKLLFFGIGNDGKVNMADRICTLLLLYEVWCARQKKFFPSSATIEENMWNNVFHIVSASAKFKKLLANNSNPWFRSRWPANNQGE
jgi:hypothetical protein